MSSMAVYIKDLILPGFHGLNKGEDIVGGEYQINLTIHYTPAILPVTSLHDTVDYTRLLQVIRERMKIATPLLETLVTEIASEIFAKFSLINDVEISISKLHPPIANFQGSVGVNYSAKRPL